MKILIVASVLTSLTVLGAGSVQARPRDQVMSNAFRCGTIGSNYDWLDCYYGAAQPVRAALGLTPAAAHQQSLAGSPEVGTVLPADLRARDQVMAEASRCYEIGEDRQWLNCYYGAAATIRAVLRLSTPSGTASTASAVAPAPNSPGKERGKAVLAHMAGYAFDKYRWFTVELDNGQIWRQISGDTNYASWKEPAGHYLVDITPGFARSFNLRVVGHAGLYKVVRIR